MNNITFKPIGTINTPFKEPLGVPIQPSGAKGIEGRVENAVHNLPDTKDDGRFIE